MKTPHSSQSKLLGYWLFRGAKEKLVEDGKRGGVMNFLLLYFVALALAMWFFYQCGER